MAKKETKKVVALKSKSEARRIAIQKDAKPVKEKAIKKEKLIVHKNVSEALFAFQNEDIIIPRNGTGKSAQGKAYKYATLDDTINISRPFLMKHGLMFTQLIHTDKMETVLVHASTETKISSDINLGNPSNMQDYGGRITYARRYALTALLGLSGEEDTDAVPVIADEAPKSLNKAPQGTNVAPAPIIKTMEINPGDVQHVNVPVVQTLQPVVEEAENKPLRSESFTKAKNAIDTAYSPDAIELLGTQLDRSTKLSPEEKVELKELLKARDTEVNGTIHR